MRKKEKRLISKYDFKNVIMRASQPIKQDLKKSEKKKVESYNGKQTRQHNSGDTSGKHSGKFH